MALNQHRPVALCVSNDDDDAVYIHELIRISIASSLPEWGGTFDKGGGGGDGRKMLPLGSVRTYN